MDPSDITPEGLVADARTEAHARRCDALRQLVAMGELAKGDDDDDDDDGGDAAAAAHTAPSRDLVALVDLDALEANARRLQRDAGFPSDTLHTFAVKANPCEGVLRTFAALGFGAEVASLGELEAALAAGFRPDMIVFDSPCKTRAELRRAILAGVRINLDSLQEIARVAALLERTAWGRAVRATIEDQFYEGIEPPTPPALFGVRVNPQVGAGSIDILSTAADDSKFGVPIGDAGQGSERAALAAAFREHRWLRALHMHVGSQGVPLETVVEGAARTMDFARELGPRRAVALDIGGGVPVDYSSDAPAAADLPPFAKLARLLRARVPYLWGYEPEERQRRRPPLHPRAIWLPPPLLITENGRALVAKCGCVAARVEYVKHDRDAGGAVKKEHDDEDEDDEEDEGWEAPGRRPIAVIHAGADLVMRACYLPDQWSLRLLVVDGDAFQPRELQQGGAQWRARDVAGPLCFQGDRLAVARVLPPIKRGDWVVLPDAGAYTLSMFSRYNSRQSPAVWGYRGGGAAAGGLRLELLRRGETLADVVGFWAVGGGGGG